MVKFVKTKDSFIRKRLKQLNMFFINIILQGNYSIYVCKNYNVKDVHNSSVLISIVRNFDIKEDDNRVMRLPVANLSVYLRQRIFRRKLFRKEL